MNKNKTITHHSLSDDLVNKTQQVILSKEGNLIESDNQLFNLFAVPNQKIIELFDALHITFDFIHQIELGDKELFFPKIKFDFTGVELLYNLRFSKMMYQNDTVILWTITQCKEDLTQRKKQQRDNEEQMTTEQRLFLKKIKH